MILLTSDLDRTLIYSKRMLEQYPYFDEIIPVEEIENRNISFMSQKSIDSLQELNQNHLFVPVTTRAVHEFNRIHIFRNKIVPKFAITSNGGTILIDGKVDKEYDTLIRRKLDNTSIPKEELMQRFDKIRHKDWVVKEFYVEDLFYVFHIVKDNIPTDELLAFEMEIKALGWVMFLHLRKMYFLPASLTKEFAVSKLKEKIDFDIHVAAGDSLMDYGMICEADLGYSAAHGEIFQNIPNDQNVKWLIQKGINSTEELLNNLKILQTTVTR